jgi:protein AroM
MARVGTITIGQAPRPDINGDLTALLPAGTELLERGLLDELSSAEIDRLAPGASDFPLVTRLRDGSSVVVAKEKLVPLLETAIPDLESRAEAILVLCSGSFPEQRSRVPVLYPSRLLEHFVRAVAPPSAAVLVPHPGQVETARRHWESMVAEVEIFVAHPYSWHCPELPGRRGGFVIMDCLGYSLAMKNEVIEKTARRAILVRSVAAAAVRELLL